jgi:hypothetical protein
MSEKDENDRRTPWLKRPLQLQILLPHAKAIHDSQLMHNALSRRDGRDGYSISGSSQFPSR